MSQKRCIISNCKANYSVVYFNYVFLFFRFDNKAGKEIWLTSIYSFQKKD